MKADLQQLVQQAMALHQAGRFGEAEQLYARILKENPRAYATVHLMGLMRAQQGRPAEALVFFEEVLKNAPDTVETLAHYGVTLHGVGRYEDALAALDRALASRTALAETWNDRGIVLGSLKRFGEALESYDRATTLKPGQAEFWYNRAASLTALALPQGALESYDRALVLNSGLPAAHNNRGSVLLELGRAEEAVASYDRAIALLPSYAEAHSNRAFALIGLSRYDEALPSAQTAVALRADVAAFFNARGSALAGLHRHEDALADYDKAIALDRALAGAYSNRGPVLLDLKRAQDAIASCDKAIALNPVMPEAYNNRGAALTELRRFEEALADFGKALALKPDYAQAWSNQGMVLLTLGRRKEGWQSFRNRERIIHERMPVAPAWTGREDLRGKTVFVAAVAGFGDAIQFCRYIGALEAQGATVVFSLPRRLMGLLGSITHSVRTVDVKAHVPVCDYHASLYNLAEVFQPAQDSNSPLTPYLRADAGRARKWKRFLGDRGFKVGICWQGSQADIVRSFPARCFERIAAIPNLRLISLQKGTATGALSDLPVGMTVERLGEEFDDGPDAFLDTAATMESLDLVITPDTAVAHLAGALGRPIWVGLKYAADWRWFLDRSDSPWYPSMRLFRQPAYGDWDGVFAAMETELKKIAAPR